MRSLVLVVLGLGTLALAPTPARAESNNDLLSPREVALGEALRGNATGVAGVDLNPSGIALNRELVFEGGYGYRSSDSGSLISASACDSTTSLPGCFFYHHAGASPAIGNLDVHSSTHVAGFSTGRLIASRLAIGSTVKYFHFAGDVPGQQDASGWAFDFGTTVRLTNSISLGGSAINLFKTTDSVEFPRTLGGGVYARPFSILAVSFDVRYRLDGAQQAARYGGGAELFIPLSNGQIGIPLRGGVLHDNSLGGTFASAGLGYAMSQWSLDVAGRREVSGGKDNMIIASLRLFGPRLPTPGVE